MTPTSTPSTPASPASTTATSPRSLTLGPDGQARPRWANASHATRHYYDTEWGRPPTHAHAVFEMQSLLVFQNGLTWALVLARRDGIRDALLGLDPDALAALDEDGRAATLRRALDDPACIRNEAKINAVLDNGRAAASLGGEPGVRAILGIDPAAPPPGPHTWDAAWDHAGRIANALREAGFARVGPGSTFALLQAFGVLGAELVDPAEVVSPAEAASR